MFDINQGYTTLFFLSFFASTILPLGSEWLLVALILKGYQPITSVAIATCGNTLGAFTTYAIGCYGSAFFMGRVLGVSGESRQKAEKIYARYGLWSLVFSWVPVVGDPLCLVGGILKIRFMHFSLLVFLGKLGRYAAISWLALQFSSVK